MKILFDHPNPFLLAHGGFQTQIEQTKAALEGIGVEVEYLRWWDDRQTGDLIHFFGRPNGGYIDFAHQKNLKVVVAELHTGLGSRGKSARRLQKAIMTLSQRLLPSSFTARLAWDSYKKADAFVALTSWEGFLMQDMFGADPKKVHVVPNGVEQVFFKNSTSGNRNSGSDSLPSSEPTTRNQQPTTGYRSPFLSSSELPEPRTNNQEQTTENCHNFLICTATIAPRKRVAELAEAAVLAQTPLWILGRPYSETDSYYLRFVGLQKKHPEILRYEGGISDRARLAEIYQQARGFVLLSSMESLSLSALEAAAAGCPLLLSDLPWARSSFAEDAVYCPVADASHTAPHLKDFYERAALTKSTFKPQTWPEVARQLKSVYASLLKP